MTPPERGGVFDGLTPPYSTIVVDPPWHYGERRSGPQTAGKWSRMVSKPFAYSTMTVPEIAAMPVGDLVAPDAWCFLWTTNKYLSQSFGVLKGWGFQYRQTLVWHKTGGPSPFGPALAPNHAEFLLVGAVGAPKVTQRWSGSVVTHIRPRQHSEKPALFGDLIEQACPGPYVELFSRAPRLGWDSWGHGYEGAA